MLDERLTRAHVAHAEDDDELVRVLRWNKTEHQIRDARLKD